MLERDKLVLYLKRMRARVSVGASLAAIFAGPALASADTRRTEVIEVDPVLDMAPGHILAAEVSNIIYVNRCIGGCVFTPGANDSRADTVSFISTTTNVSEFEHDDATFAAVIDCLRDVYAPYDVQIVTADPGGAPHHEAVLAGSPSELGREGTIGGLAPASCQPLNNAISFSFSNNGQDVETMCWTVAQESAHTFGLPDHVFECSDAMTYIPGCGTKYFRNRSLPCGEFALNDKECRCGRDKQNSHEQLLSVFGPGTTPPGPSVEIALPTAGADVQDGFSIYAFATDPRLVHHVDLFINGSKYDELPGHTYAQRMEEYYFPAPGHPDGYMNIEIRAYNDLESDGSARITVLKGEPCQSDDQCSNEQTCEEGACTYPPATGQLGDGCEHNQQCVSAVCVDSRCSDDCDEAEPETCGDGFECVPAGERSLCWPIGGGCCSVAAHSAGDVLASALTALVVLLSLSRRRRRRAR